MQLFLKNLGSILLSLLLAVLVWIAAVEEENPPREDVYNQDIPIEIISPAVGLVTIDPIPETVRLRLMAPESSWNNLTPSKFKASLDLSALAAGLNDVPVEVEISDSQIEIVEQLPRIVTVHLEAEETITMPVKVQLMDAPPLGYTNRPPLVEPPFVKITGPASLVTHVDEAVSEVFIRNAKETVESARPVLVRDREDQFVHGLGVEPSRVQVTLPIEQRFGYKDVSVSAVIDGQVAPGYWVSNVSVDPPTLTIVGNPQALGSIPGFIETEPVSLSQATEDIVRTVPLNLPDGVSLVLPEKEPGGAGGVQVKVTIAAIESGKTVRRPITQQGIDPAYWWAASPDQAEVILSGPIPRLQTLKPDEVRVIVDLFGLQPGVHKIEPTIFAPDDLQLEAVLPAIIEITIGLNIPISPVATPTATITTTLVVTPTATGPPASSQSRFTPRPPSAEKDD